MNNVSQSLGSSLRLAAEVGPLCCGYLALAYFLAVLTFLPFVRRATNNQWKAALVPAAKLQAILFVASWLEYAATYGALQYLISISTFQKDFPPVSSSFPTEFRRYFRSVRDYGPYCDIDKLLIS